MFGLEKECLRITQDGRFAQTPHPFNGDNHIERDFCENQVEINTGVSETPEGALRELYDHTVRVQGTLAGMKEPELLWPFSNPPYIACEEEIPIAQYTGEREQKTRYREHLAKRYGKYKMTLSGIHINYSFSDEYLEEKFEKSGFENFTAYKNDLYLKVAEKAAAYGWLMTAVTAASPVMDSSFFEEGVKGNTVFSGMASVRCSETGYWNYFAPVLDYSDIKAYAKSVQRYVEYGWLAQESELYYPVRLKSKGSYDLERLYREGVDHIELRMIDLNPLEQSGLDIRDLKFAELFLLWLAGSEKMQLRVKDQIQAVQNFKNAAHYDMKVSRIVFPDGCSYTMEEAGIRVIGSMKKFFAQEIGEIQDILDFEEEKFRHPEKRYAWIIKKAYGDDFVKKGIKLAKMQQMEAVKNR